MLPINDSLPIDLSTSATQTIDIKDDLLPDANLSGNFADILRKPLAAEHEALLDVAGDDLPLSGSPLPVESMLEDIDPSLLVPQDFDAELPPLITPTAESIAVDAEVAIEMDAAPLSATDAFPLGDDPEIAVQAINPAPQEIRADEQARLIDDRRRRSALNPAIRHPLQMVKSSEGMQYSLDDPAFAERQAPVREIPQTSQPQQLRSHLDVMADRITPEVTTNAAVNSKVEGGEQIQKPLIQFSGIATNGVPIDTSQVRQPSPAMTAPAPAVTTTIDVPVLDKTWGHALQDRVTWMTGRGVQNAEIRLNPAELGPIRVQVSVENDAAQLVFSAQNAVTRDAIEQAMPRLREMLAESGLSLGGSTVSDGGDKDVKRDQDLSEVTVQDDEGLVEQDELDISSSPVREPGPTSLIDTFA